MLVLIEKYSFSNNIRKLNDNQELLKIFGSQQEKDKYQLFFNKIRESKEFFKFENVEFFITDMDKINNDAEGNLKTIFFYLNIKHKFICTNNLNN